MPISPPPPQVPLLVPLLRPAGVIFTMAPMPLMPCLGPPLAVPTTTGWRWSRHHSHGDADSGMSLLNLYIRGLPPSTSDADLVTMCHGFGRITSAKAIVDRATGQCKGYGFVMFETPEQARAALSALSAVGVQVSFAKVPIAPSSEPRPR